MLNLLFIYLRRNSSCSVSLPPYDVVMLLHRRLACRYPPDPISINQYTNRPRMEGTLRGIRARLAPGSGTGRNIGRTRARGYE